METKNPRTEYQQVSSERGISTNTASEMKNTVDGAGIWKGR